MPNQPRNRRAGFHRGPRHNGNGAADLPRRCCPSVLIKQLTACGPNLNSGGNADGSRGR